MNPESVPKLWASLALERFHQAGSWFESPVMTLEPPGEGLMRLSRSNKLVLFGIALLMVGLAGRAAAEETPSTHAQAKPAASAAAPAKKKPAKRTESTKQKAVTVSARQGSGPAGSRMVTGNRAVALTFDDGPDPAETPKILRLLAQQRVHATFCLVGRNVAKFPGLVRQIVAGGNTVCNHTWSHDLKLGKKSPAQIKADMARTNAAIRKAAPKAKIKYFRAPGGNFTPGVVSIAKSMGMSSLYWKVDPRDWDHPKGETDAQHRARVISKVERNTHAGVRIS